MLIFMKTRHNLKIKKKNLIGVLTRTHTYYCINSSVFIQFIFFRLLALRYLFLKILQINAVSLSHDVIDTFRSMYIFTIIAVTSYLLINITESILYLFYFFMK